VVGYSTGPRPLKIGGESAWKRQVHAAGQGTESKVVVQRFSIWIGD